MKPAKCDQASFEDAVQKEIMKDAQQLNEIVKFKCADGWAAVNAGVGNPPAWVTQQFIFQAEGEFWVPVKQKEACAPGSPLPASLYKLGCEQVIG